MDQLRLGLGPTEETVTPNGVPEELRCKRSDGKQWRCSALSMPDKTVCEKHYIQAKKRAANSALRASLKKSKRMAEIEGEGDPYLERKRVNLNNGFAGYGVASRPVRPVEARHENNVEGYNSNFAEARVVCGNGAATPMECIGTCHQCGKNSSVSWCESCEKRGYCANCISKWYNEISIEQIRKVCPACRGICNCHACLQGDNIIKTKVQEMNGMEKLKYLHRLLVYVLPVVKEIYSDQCFEIGVEARAHGTKVEITRARISPDQQMLCDFCKVPIFDYHRHCLNCSFDLCLSCCREIRESSKKKNNNLTKFSKLLPNWKASTVGTVPCRPDGCGASELVLRRLLKINWISKLVKNTEEMVNGCRVQKQMEVSSEAAETEKGFYCLSLEELIRDGIHRFCKSWEWGVPILVKQAFEFPVFNSWDPLSILRGSKDTTDEKTDENILVKAFDCTNQSEVEIELSEFIKGYSKEAEKEGTSPVLKLMEWPSPSVLEEFLTCQRPEFLANFPLIEFIHSKWGVTNLPSKLPHDASMPEMGPKLLISYGNESDNQEFCARSSNSGVNLRVNMWDVVYMLMHTVKRKEKDKFEETLEKCNGNQTISNSSKVEIKSDNWGAIWDVFRREDVPKLNEFLRSRLANSIEYPVYDGSIFLNEEEKRILKNEFGVEPWRIKQNIGDAVFIPTGCPFQFTNLQSSVQLEFDFLFPESISESVRMAHEIRCLPNGHLAKLNIIEVRKICLYAASSAIREIQKMSLDPKLKLENRFEDRNLTEAVSENLARISSK